MDARYDKEAVSMKKQELIKSSFALISAIVMIIVSLTGYRTVLPTGLAFMPLAGVIAIGLSLSLGAKWSLPTTIIAVVIMMLIGTADWVVLLDFILLLIVVGLIINWQVPLDQDLTHQQLLRLAILTGLFQFAVMIVIYGLIGLIVAGSMATSLTFVGLILPNAILTGLLYAFLGAPIALLMRWLLRQFLHVDSNHHNSGNDDHQRGSVIIDLSNKKAHQDQKEDH